MAGTVWRPVKIGGGGYVTGIDTSNDGSTLICRTDTFGGYVWEASAARWRQILTYAAFGNAAVYPDLFRGVTEFRVAPSKPELLYMAFMGDIWRSNDTGLTWTKLGLNWGSVTESNANSTARIMGQKMAVDPSNPDIVYWGTPSSGVYRTFDAGSNWELISTGSIPACATAFSGVNPGHPGICFDPSSGTTGGRTNTIFVPVYGGGVYQSTDAGQTWSLLTGGPSSVRHACCASDGVYYAANVNGTLANTLYKYASGSWTAIGPGNRSVEGVCADPSDAARIVAFYDNSVPRASADRGATWGTFLNQDVNISRVGNGIPWLAATREQFISAGDMLFDRVTPGKLWLAHGIGVASTTHTGNPSSITWTYDTKGIENLTSNCCVIPPNGVPLAASWDRPVFRVDDPETYPSWHGPYQKFTAADIDTANNTITLPNHRLPSNLNTVVGTISGTPPAPLANFVPYFVIVNDANSIKLSATTGPGTAIDLTNVGSGEHALFSDSIRMAWHLDWATSDPTYCAYVGAFAVTPALAGNGFYSDDGGRNWYEFVSYPGKGSVTYSGIDGPGNADKIGGCIACASPTNIIWVPSNNAQPYVTHDGGVTWTEILISGVARWMDATFTNGSKVVVVADTSNLVQGDAFDATSGFVGAGTISTIDGPTQVTISVNALADGASSLRVSPGWGWAYFNKHVCVAADRVAANTFYLYNINRQGLYRSTDGGDNWTKMNTGNIDTQASTAAKLRSVPGKHGHLFLAAGKSGNPGDANPGTGRLKRSTDGGATWADAGGGTIREPYCVGFGAAAPGQSYPAIYFVGWLNGVYGIWRSNDECATWESVGTNPFGWVDIPIDIDGSKEVYGTVYLTFNGSSFAYRTEAMQYGRLR